jgi:rare lipoprotein A
MDGAGDDPVLRTSHLDSDFTWTPPDSPADGTYTGGGPWNGGSGCSGDMLAGTKAMKAVVQDKFGISDVEGYNCRQNTANTSEVSMHGTGRALDIMTSGSDGAKVADWLVTNHQALGIQFVIFSHTKWNASSGPGSYGGPNPHTDHVHAELTEEMANNAAGPTVPADGAGPAAPTGNPGPSDNPTDGPPSPESPPPTPNDPSTGGLQGTDQIETCQASFYDEGQQTASGEPFDPNAMTAAHKTLPFNTMVRVTNTGTGQSVDVRINDRGPFVTGRCIDLSRAAFDVISSESAGTAPVTVEVLQ